MPDFKALIERIGINEGFRSKPYQCSEDVWTIGHGLTWLTEEDSLHILTGRISQLHLKLGEKLDFNIGISGTHPTAMCKDQKFVNNESYNWVADQMNYYARRNVTFATHVHIAINDENHAIHVANALRRWIAPLLALSTNSPFFENELTGLRSSRTFQFGVFPRTNIPVRFNDFNEYETLVNKYNSNSADFFVERNKTNVIILKSKNVCLVNQK